MLAQDSFVCNDHRLQTILSYALERNHPLTVLLKKSNQSALTCGIIQAEAKELEAPYIKIIAPVTTSWNSLCVMVESINTMEVIFKSLREESTNIGAALPTKPDFAHMKNVEMILGIFEALKRAMSAD